MKPEARLFSAACDALGVVPGEALMVGDTIDSDGGATVIGCRFASSACHVPRVRCGQRWRR